MRKLPLALLSLAIAACASPEERRIQAEIHRQNLEATCYGYGFAVGTPEMARCMMQLDQEARRAEQARNAAALSYIQQQQAIQAQQPIYQPVPIPRTPTETTCRKDAFGTVRCTTY